MYSRSFSDRSAPEDIPAQYAGTALQRERREERSDKEPPPEKAFGESEEEKRERPEEKDEEAVRAGLFDRPAHREPPHGASPPPYGGEGGLLSSLRGLFGDGGIEAEDLLLLAIALLLFTANREDGLLPLALLFLLLIK